MNTLKLRNRELKGIHLCGWDYLSCKRGEVLVGAKDCGEQESFIGIGIKIQNWSKGGERLGDCKRQWIPKTLSEGGECIENVPLS